MVVTRSTADSTRSSTRLAASEDCDYDFTSRRRPTARANAGTRTARSSGSAAQLSRVLVPAQAKQRRARKRAKRKASKQAAGQVKKRQRSGLKPKAPQARRKRAPPRLSKAPQRSEANAHIRSKSLPRPWTMSWSSAAPRTSPSGTKLCCRGVPKRLQSGASHRTLWLAASKPPWHGARSSTKSVGRSSCSMRWSTRLLKTGSRGAERRSPGARIRSSSGARCVLPSPCACLSCILPLRTWRVCVCARCLSCAPCPVVPLRVFLLCVVLVSSAGRCSRCWS